MTVCKPGKDSLGYLMISPRPRFTSFHRESKPALVDLLRAAAAHEPPAPLPAIVHKAPRMPTGALGRPKRSIVVASMYMLDLLHLQRSAKAADLVAALGCGSDQDTLIDALLNALHYLLTVSSMEHGTRIAERFAEVVPEIALAQVANVVARRLYPNVVERAI